VLGCFAGKRHDLITETGEHIDRQGADATARTGDKDGSVPGRKTICFHALDRERGRETGGADCHGIENGKSVGQRHYPVGGQARALRVTAVVIHAEAVTGSEHCIANIETRIARRLDRTGQVDPTDAGKAPHDLAGAGGGQRVLIVDAGVQNADDNLARVQIIERYLDETRGNLAVVVEQAIGFEA
jgi:hypothetical protein